MIVDGIIQVFLCGLFGGLLGELIKWYRLRTSDNLPKYVKSGFYWIVTILIIVAGGILTVLYGTSNVNAILAVNIGISAPLVIQSLAKNKIQDLGLKPNGINKSRESTKSLKFFFISNKYYIWLFLAGE